MYSKQVLDRFTNPQNVGLIKGADGVGVVSLGEVIKLYIKVESQNIVDAKFKAAGSAATFACVDVAIDLIKGKSIDHALKLSSEDVLEQLGELPEQKADCANLAVQVISSAIADFRKKELKKATKVDN